MFQEDSALQKLMETLERNGLGNSPYYVALLQDRPGAGKMAERTIKYRYEGKRYTVTIPAGSDVFSLIDENGYCGFRTLDSQFGGSELTVG